MFVMAGGYAWMAAKIALDRDIDQYRIGDPRIAINGTGSPIGAALKTE